MTPQERYTAELTGMVTEQQFKDGWHICPEWDGMCIHKDSPEYDACLCGLEWEKFDSAIGF